MKEADSAGMAYFECLYYSIRGNLKDKERLELLENIIQYGMRQCAIQDKEFEKLNEGFHRATLERDPQEEPERNIDRMEFEDGPITPIGAIGYDEIPEIKFLRKFYSE